MSKTENRFQSFKIASAHHFCLNSWTLPILIKLLFPPFLPLSGQLALICPLENGKCPLCGKSYKTFLKEYFQPYSYPTISFSS